jgi:hypothetical protein
MRDLFLTAVGIRLSGTVVDAATGLPIPGASVELIPSNPTSGFSAASATTSTLGGFQLVVPSGHYTLNASAGGYASASFAIDVNRGSVPVEVALTEAAVTGSAASSLPFLPLGAVAAAAALGVAVLVTLRRRRPKPVAPPSPPRWTLDEDAEDDRSAVPLDEAPT